MEPREYQKAIVETAKKSNTLVVLPTGLGKTHIALMLAIERLKIENSKILFLAPTRPLASQHLEYFKKNLDLEKEMHIFTGKIAAKKRAEIWKTAEIIFSTPQCIENDLKNKLISLENVSLLIEDECHRAVKNYSYVSVVKKYIEEAKNQKVLGLTASPSSEPKTIREICKILNIEAVEIRTRESPDVEPYLQKLTKETIRVELSDEIKKPIVMLRTLHKKKIEELQNRKLLFAPPTKTNIIALQKRLQQIVFGGNKHFNVLKGLSICAQAIKLHYMIELLETQTIESCYNYAEELYSQANQKKSKAAVQIVNSKEFQDAYLILTKLYQANIEHPKIQKLVEILQKEAENKKEFRAIVFSQYRDTVAKIKDELTKKGIKAEVFIGQAKRKLNGLSQKEQQLILYKFKESEINVLVATSIGEEGLDISEVNLVIFYEPVPSAIRQKGKNCKASSGQADNFDNQGNNR